MLLKIVQTIKLNNISNKYILNKFRYYSTLPNQYGLLPTLKEILNNCQQKDLEVRGWLQTFRKQKKWSFGLLNDGTITEGLQLVFNNKELEESLLKRLTTGASIKAFGTLKPSVGTGQKWELGVQEVEIIGDCDPEIYPLQKKSHSNEFLREHGHLRPRTTSLGALLRLRSYLMEGFDIIFKNQNFIEIHAPIITSHDCEGGGEAFEIKAQGYHHHNEAKNQLSKQENIQSHFFNHPTHLTVSAQLHLELVTNALTRVYSKSPVFRAEGSITSRHLAEFWMLETEVAFIDKLDLLMDLCEKSIKETLKYTFKKGENELNTLWKFNLNEDNNNNNNEKNLLSLISDQSFHRITYKEAIDILSKVSEKFEFQPIYGQSLQSEHERYLSDEHFQSPVFVTHYPKAIKPFYMKLTSDKELAICFDLLVPGVGELVGGSLREENYNLLKDRMIEENIQDLNWYLELRKFGGVPHGGFGLGIERLLQWLSNTKHIRDIVPWPRYRGICRF